MPDRGSGTVLVRWQRLGVVLPAAVRERVYEPALNDLWLRWIAPQEGPKPGFALHATGTFLGCLPLAVGSLFVNGGRLTRFGRLTFRVAVGAAVLLLTIRVVANALGLYR